MTCGNHNEEELNNFKQRLGIQALDDFLLLRALTHRSYLNENHAALEDNERLEFLGDSILSFVVAEWLYHHFPDKPEGDLTKLRAAIVSTDQLAGIARQFEVGRYIQLGRGEDQAGGRDRNAILCDTFEALIGAVYLALGLVQVNAILTPIIEQVIEGILIEHQYEDPKSILQEWAQASGSASLKYFVLAEKGPDHSKTFEVEVRIDDKKMGVGKGSSKQQAEKAAARQALEFINKLDN